MPVTGTPFARSYRFTDGVLQAVDQRLAQTPPERGGALLASGELVHLLLEDTDGKYTAASWDISPQLAQAIGAVEQAGHGQLIGTCHSHPRGTPDPSDTDVRTTSLALEVNPHLPELLIAVVTEGRPRDYDLPIGEGHRMSLHVLRRTQDGPALVRVSAAVTSITDDLEHAGVTMTSTTTATEWTAAENPHRRSLGPATGAEVPGRLLPATLRLNGRHRLVVPLGEQRGALLVDALHPLIGPLLLPAEADSITSSPWDPAADPSRQLAALVATAVKRPIANATLRVDTLTGILRSTHAVIAGAGSVGSRIAEDLTRAGVGHLTLIDPDDVAAVNLSRTVYTAADIGEPKCQALKRRLQAINPAIVVDPITQPLGQVDLALMFTPSAHRPAPDLILGATDDMAEQAVLAHHAYHHEIPLVACALYRAAAAGEIVIVCPQATTACWLCATGQSTGSAVHRPATNYGLGGRLDGEIALGPAIQLVATAASNTALGVLAGPNRPAGEPLVRLLAEHRTLGVIATSPDWEWFPTVLPDMAHQHAPQSVWIRVSPQHDCGVCGDHPVPPASHNHGAALLEVLEELTKPSSRHPDLTRP